MIYVATNAYLTLARFNTTRTKLTLSPPLAGLIERLLERLMVKPCQTL